MRTSGSEDPEAPRRRQPPWRRWAATAYVVGGGVTGFAILAKSEALSDALGLALPRAIADPLLGATVVLPAVALRFLGRLAGGLAVPLLLGLCAVALTVQPAVQDQQDLDRGTDQDDCVIVGVEELTAGRWPYDSSLLWSGNAMSCGPGWILLHSPAELWGYPATMSLAWLGTVATAALVRGRRFAADLVVLVAGIPGVWLAFANGTDFATFAFVLTALSLAAGSRHRVVRGAAAALSVPVSQFRFPFFAAPALFVDRPPATGWRAAALAVGAGLLGWLAFAAWDLRSLVDDGPLNVVRKASGGTGGAVAALLAFVSMTVFAVVAAASSIRWTRPRGLFVYCTALLAPMVATTLVGEVLSGGSPLEALGSWEGTSWVTTIVIVSAFLVVSETHGGDRGRDRLQDRPESADDNGVHRPGVPGPAGPSSG